MKNLRSIAVILALGTLVGVGISASGALAAPESADNNQGDLQLGVTSQGDAQVAVLGDDRPAAEVAAEFDEFYAEVLRTNLMPVGVNADETGPYGWVEYDRAVVTVGEQPPDLKVMDANGVHIGWIVNGLPPMTIDEYNNADPEALRQSGLDRIEEFKAGAVGAVN